MKFKRTQSLLDLEGFPFAIRFKSGAYEPQKTKTKKTTHRVEMTKEGVLTIPLKEWPKGDRTPISRYSHIIDMKIPEIPAGATHFAYRNSSIELIGDVKFVNDFKDSVRGEIIFGKYYLGSDRFESLMPTPVAELEDGVCRLASEHRSMRKEWEELPRKRGFVEAPKTSAKKSPKKKAAKPPKASKATRAKGTREHRNGVTKPGEGGKTAKVWAICEKLFAELGQVPTKAAVLEIALADGLNPGMTGTQWSYWRRFYEHPKPPKA